ncbi:MAG: Gfo/Idh/MocA family oxidoreductase [Terriglobia bacterium]|jgi:predicted dehydrogenase
MLRVAIVGCGKIADLHAEQIQYIPGCQIVGVCDREELMAQQLAERLNVPAHFTEVQDLLDHAKPDVVHITTPPQTHHSIGKSCLEAGRHVYIEKPFTIHFKEAQELISLAEHKNLKLTVGHHYQFSHAARRMRELVAEGYLGGSPVHMDSYYGYDLGGGDYARALLGDRHHWVRKLPGLLLQNTISHGISKVAEFLKGDVPQVIAYGFTSPFLRNLGEAEIIDELRVIIHDETATAYFTFSSQMRPCLHQLWLYGPRNGLIVDERQQTVIKVNGSPYRSYLQQFVPPWGYAKQYIGNSLGNMRKFLKADFQADYGMKVLIKTLYHSITEGGPLPIPYEEILRTSRIMEEIFSQLRSSRPPTNSVLPPET